MSRTQKETFDHSVKKTLNALQKPVWGKIDWKRQLSESQLSEEITSVVQAVLTACRLSRSEKAAVAEELLSHFRDGLDRGQSAQELIEDFGDPAIAAPLIQSAKRRNRPMWKKSLQFSAYGIASLAAAYVIISIWFHIGQPTPSIDYVAKMNQPIAEIADSEKAWPIYRPMWTKYKFSEGGQFDIPEMWCNEVDPNYEDITYTRLIRQDDAGFAAAREAFAQHADLLDAFRQGAQKPYFGVELQNDPNKYSDEDFAAIFPANSRKDFESLSVDAAGIDDETNQLIGESVVMVMLPHVQVMRQAARIFVVDTRLAVAENDSKRALQDLETMLGLARHSAEGPVLICSLVGYAIVAITFDQIEEIFEADPDFFNDEQLARLQTAVQSADIQGWLHFEGERMMIEDIIQRTYTDDGNGDGRLTPQGVKFLTSSNQLWGLGTPSQEEDNVLRWGETLFGPASLFVAASRKEVTELSNQLLDQVIDDANKPFWEANHFDLDAELDQKPFKYALLDLMLPAVQQVRFAMDRALGRQQGVLGAIALQRYRNKNGKWPESWNEIPETIVQSAPLDQINGEPLKFKITSGRPLIYSVGNDRDDDGGHHLKAVAAKTYLSLQPDGFIPEPVPTDQTADGDWILWPQRSENRE